MGDACHISPAPGMGQCGLAGDVPYVNMGIGMVLIASPEEAARIEGHLQAQNEVVYRIGRVTEGGHEVVIKGGVFDA